MITKEKAIEIWQELGITSANFEFSCGGDSMNDTTLTFKTSEGDIDDNDLQHYFDDVIYKEIEFYVNSDGHYQGEFGNVEIELQSDNDEPYFTFSKNSQSEWTERFNEKQFVELTEDEINLVKRVIQNMNGAGFSDFAISYKGDCILTDNEETLLEGITNKLNDFAENYEFEIAEGEDTEDYSWTTNSDDEQQIVIQDNSIQIEIEKTFTIFKDEE
jgi:hypothetical protein